MTTLTLFQGVELSDSDLKANAPSNDPHKFLDINLDEFVLIFYAKWLELSKITQFAGHSETMKSSP